MFFKQEDNEFVKDGGYGEVKGGFSALVSAPLTTDVRSPPLVDAPQYLLLANSASADESLLSSYLGNDQEFTQVTEQPLLGAGVAVIASPFPPKLSIRRVEPSVIIGTTTGNIDQVSVRTGIRAPLLGRNHKPINIPSIRDLDYDEGTNIGLVGKTPNLMKSRKVYALSYDVLKQM